VRQGWLFNLMMTDPKPALKRDELANVAEDIHHGPGDPRGRAVAASPPPVPRLPPLPPEPGAGSQHLQRAAAGVIMSRPRLKRSRYANYWSGAVGTKDGRN
jgi:hypothetical protein